MTSVAIYDSGEGRKVGLVLMIVGNDRDNHSFSFLSKNSFFFLSNLQMSQQFNLSCMHVIVYKCMHSTMRHNLHVDVGTVATTTTVVHTYIK